VDNAPGPKRITVTICVMPTEAECPDLDSWDIADPALLIEQIAHHHPMTPGAVLFALVNHPSTDQDIVHVERLPIDCRGPVPDDLSQQLCDAMDRLPLPEKSHPILHTLVTVIVRSGFTVLGQKELEWMLGWRYSNHFRPAFTGDLILVTEHGWLDWRTGWGGHEPRMIDPA